MPMTIMLRLVECEMPYKLIDTIYSICESLGRHIPGSRVRDWH